MLRSVIKWERCNVLFLKVNADYILFHVEKRIRDIIIIIENVFNFAKMAKLSGI